MSITIDLLENDLRKLEERMNKVEIKQDECARWEAEHDGRITAWWKQQFHLNEDIRIRLTAVERKVIYASGFSAGVGAIIGIIASQLLLNLGG